MFHFSYDLINLKYTASLPVIINTLEINSAFPDPSTGSSCTAAVWDDVGEEDIVREMAYCTLDEAGADCQTVSNVNVDMDLDKVLPTKSAGFIVMASDPQPLCNRRDKRQNRERVATAMIAFVKETLY